MKALNREQITEKLSNGLIWGIERESLRLDSNGDLAISAHPESLPSPFFTRDFAESQLEIVTRPHNQLESLCSELLSLTEWAESEIGDEHLWPYSMPPHWIRDQNIKLAQLDGIENLYRKGLALRYGLKRQLISGIHINVSLSDVLLNALSSSLDEEKIYLKLTRYLYSRLPLLIVFFGGSPYSADRQERGLSWRNSPLGYGGTSYRQYLNLSSLARYINGIEKGLRRESSTFSHNGLWNGKERLQINTRVFQSEKEFYAPIRIKGTQGLTSLKKGDISRLEIRIPDLDPYVKTGISIDSLRLMEMFIVSGLLSEEVIKEMDLEEAYKSSDILSLSDPLALSIPKKLINQYQEMEETAEILDRSNDEKHYASTYQLFMNQLEDPQRTLSGRLAKDQEEQKMPISMPSIWQSMNIFKGENHVLTV